MNILDNNAAVLALSVLINIYNFIHLADAYSSSQHLYLVNKRSLNDERACSWILKTNVVGAVSPSRQSRAVLQFIVDVTGCLTKWEFKNLESKMPHGLKHKAFLIS